MTWALLALSGALNAPPRASRALGVFIAALALASPWFPGPGAPQLRAACALGSFLAVFRNLEVYRDPRAWRLANRILHVIAVVDTRRVKAVAPRFDFAALGRALAFGVGTALSVWFVLALGAPVGPWGYALRWLSGALFAYCSIEVLMALVAGVFCLFGAGLPRLHADPILSTSLGEFWGKRWNLIVHEVLREHCFRPLALRFGVAGAVFGTFCISGVLHFWLALAGAGLGMAVSMVCFFVVQGALVLLEQRLAVRRWRRPLQHVWTVSMVLLPSPLLVEPLLRVTFGP